MLVSQSENPLILLIRFADGEELSLPLDPRLGSGLLIKKGKRVAVLSSYCGH